MQGEYSYSQLRAQHARMGEGFTLIEIMVALVILTVGMLALETGYISVINSQQVAQERLMAVHLAEQVLEDWQYNAKDYVPNISSTCVLSARTSKPAYPLSVPCTPLTLAVRYTIRANTSPAEAPLPSNPNDGGRPLVAPNRGSFSIRPMKPVMTPAGTSVMPMLKVVKVSWIHKGKLQIPIVLTQISRLH